MRVPSCAMLKGDGGAGCSLGVVGSASGAVGRGLAILGPIHGVFPRKRMTGCFMERWRTSTRSFHSLGTTRSSAPGSSKKGALLARPYSSGKRQVVAASVIVCSALE